MEFIGTFNKPLNEVVPAKVLDQFSVVTSFLAFQDDCQVSRQGEKTVFFWGSLYNSKYWEKEYGAFRNDAKLASTLFLAHGLEGLKLLDGEFTIMIKDADKLLVYRDRHGASEQLYYTNEYFASHQESLLGFRDFTPEPSWGEISLFLNAGYISSPKTALQGVSKLSSGSFLEHCDGRIVTHSLYSFDDFGLNAAPLNLSLEEAAEEYERLHKKAISDRVGSSDHVQLLLSGGYDSGGNISALRDVYGGDVSSFSIGFKDNQWSELPLASVLSETFDTRHHEYKIDGSEIEYLPELIRKLGDPFVENGFMVNFCAMKMIKEARRKGIILGGDGNDQNFGTYGRELAMDLKYRSNGFHLVQNLIHTIAEWPVCDQDNFLFKIRFHNENILHKYQGPDFGWRESYLRKLLKNNYVRPDHFFRDEIPTATQDFDEIYFLNNFYFSIKQDINEVILFKASKIAASFGNQMSFPYMSTELWDFVKRLPREYKMSGSPNSIAKGKGIAKFLHKHYLKPLLPDVITNRKKQGGFAPMAAFFSDPAQFKRVKMIILQSRLGQKHLDQTYLQSIFHTFEQTFHSKGYWFWYKQIKAVQLFNLLALVVWWEQMIERNPIDCLSEMLPDLRKDKVDTWTGKPAMA